MTQMAKVRATKVRQLHAALPQRRPGQPVNIPNYVAQRAESAKKSARRTARPRKAAA